MLPQALLWNPLLPAGYCMRELRELRYDWIP